MNSHTCQWICGLRPELSKLRATQLCLVHQQVARASRADAGDAIGQVPAGVGRNVMQIASLLRQVVAL
jgi:hypothetical protein